MTESESDLISFLHALSLADWQIKVTNLWTVKDVVAHLVGWTRGDPATIRKAWATKQQPWFYQTDDYDEFNRRNVDFYRPYSPARLLNEWVKWRQRVDKTITRIGPGQLQARSDLFRWLFDYEPNSHEKIHLKQIKRAIKTAHDLAGRPPKTVLRQFGAIEPPRRLPSEWSSVWHSGKIILKRTDNLEKVAWAARVYSKIKPHGFRVAKPIRSKSGAWIVGHWSAWEYLAGCHEPGRWPEKIKACIAYHSALRSIPRPPFLNRRPGVWGRADRASWDEQTVRCRSLLASDIRRLERLKRPIKARSQLIHGDIGGNIVFAPKLAPGIIDFTPYWRPAEFALALLIVDALTWGGATPAIFKLIPNRPNFDQFLIRAEQRRLLEVDQRFHSLKPSQQKLELKAHQRTVKSVEKFVSDRP